MIDNCYTYYAIILPTAVGLRLFKVLVAHGFEILLPVRLGKWVFWVFSRSTTHR